MLHLIDCANLSQYIEMSSMRKFFDFGSRKALDHWFPRHMGKGLRQIRAILQKVDCVIEVHDCRIPFSGRNPILSDALATKPKLLVLNKADMARHSIQDGERLHEKLNGIGIRDYIVTTCLAGEGGAIDPSVSKIIPLCVDLINSNFRHDREGENTMDMVVVGVPNVGKSSLINAIRRNYLQKGTIQRTIAKSPGHTRSVMFKIKVCERPLVHLYDTPGILEPNITDLHCGMKLALCNTVQDHLLGSAMIADYLLFVLNQKREFKYVSRYQLQEPVDIIQEVLHHIALKSRRYQTRKIFTGTGSQIVKIPDYEYSASVMLKDFRDGNLGRFSLDDLNL